MLLKSPKNNISIKSVFVFFLFVSCSFITNAQSLENQRKTAEFESHSIEGRENESFEKVNSNVHDFSEQARAIIILKNEVLILESPENKTADKQILVEKQKQLEIEAKKYIKEVQIFGEDKIQGEDKKLYNSLFQKYYPTKEE